MNALKQYGLLAAIFITGGCVLIIEIVALRILSPYFGTTIFTVSSVLGVILAALSLGYYMGGKIADAHRSVSLFFALIFIGGVSILILRALMLWALPLLGSTLSFTYGPLTASILLFFIPAFILGMLSPFAITLQHLNNPAKGSGTVSGEVFFWSTIGSIAGSIASGFVLIPRFSISGIVISTGLALALVGLLPLAVLTSKKRTIALIGTLVLGYSATLMYASARADARFLFHDDGVYSRIAIFDDRYENMPTRFMRLDGSHASAMFLDSDELVYEYSKYYALHTLFVPVLNHVLVIGGGAYSIPKKLIQTHRAVIVDVAEIEPTLLEIGKTYFRVPDDPRLRTYVQDGRRFVRESAQSYDMIISDAYLSIHSLPPHLATAEFFSEVKNRLSDNGIFIANVIGSLSERPPSLTFSILRTFRTVFPNSYFFATENPSDARIQNIIFVGYNSDSVIAIDHPALRNSETPIIRSLHEKQIDPNRFALDQYLLLTDDFAPIEYLSAGIYTYHPPASP